ncbi:uncharacterized protein VTP21DRAFT_8385 [Calcarisporiella thermophila]|uniref:uncharacterized protein n=1 Tax=Calcarisporiella thermophila TaxID=911321 RepID=UPI003741F474
MQPPSILLLRSLVNLFVFFWSLTRIHSTVGLARLLPSIYSRYKTRLLISWILLFSVLILCAFDALLVVASTNEQLVAVFPHFNPDDVQFVNSNSDSTAFSLRNTTVSIFTRPMNSWTEENMDFARIGVLLAVVAISFIFASLFILISFWATHIHERFQEKDFGRRVEFPIYFAYGLLSLISGPAVLVSTFFLVNWRTSLLATVAFFGGQIVLLIVFHVSTLFRLRRLAMDALAADGSMTVMSSELFGYARQTGLVLGVLAAILIPGILMATPILRFAASPLVARLLRDLFMDIGSFAFCLLTPLMFIILYPGNTLSLEVVIDSHPSVGRHADSMTRFEYHSDPGASGNSLVQTRWGESKTPEDEQLRPFGAQAPNPPLYARQRTERSSSLPNSRSSMIPHPSSSTVYPLVTVEEESDSYFQQPTASHPWTMIHKAPTAAELPTPPSPVTYKDDRNTDMMLSPPSHLRSPHRASATSALSTNASSFSLDEEAYAWVYEYANQGFDLSEFVQEMRIARQQSLQRRQRNSASDFASPPAQSLTPTTPPSFPTLNQKDSEEATIFVNAMAKRDSAPPGSYNAHSIDQFIPLSDYDGPEPPGPSRASLTEFGTKRN